MTKKDADGSLNPSLRRISKLHLIFTVILAAQIIVYDASKLITADIVLKRWAMVVALFVAASIVWYCASSRSSRSITHSLLWMLIFVDIAVISYSIYLQRGMASRAVILYLIPIITAAVLAKKSAIYLTAAFCAAAYVFTSIAYFVLNFNEGYKVELYGEVLFYAAILFLSAGLVWAVVRLNKHK